MRFPWIENYAGTWHDDEGRTLIITTCDDENATVDLLVHGAPMIRPWCGNRPVVRLRARYSPADGPGLEIDLGRPGFSLNVNYELADPMSAGEPESLSVGVSWYESDAQAEQFSELFGKLRRYRRAHAEQMNPGD